MHNIKLTNLIIFIIYVFITLYFSSVLLGYNSIFFKLIIIGIAILPFVFTQIVKSRNYWLIIAFASTIYIAKIPLPFLDALNIGYIVNAMLLGLLFAELAMKKIALPNIFMGFTNRCMAFFTFVITARFLIDRPGAGSMGGVGGLSTALPTLLAGWCFFSVYIFAREWKPCKQQIKILYIFAILGLTRIIYRNIMLYIPLGHFINIFPYPSVWVLLFFPLATQLNQLKDSFKTPINLKVLIMTAAIMLLSLISMNRAPILYTPAAMATVYWCYHKANRYILILALGLLALISFTTFFPQLVPRSAVRTLSLISENIVNEKGQQGLGETGWESDWRTKLAQIAWEDIKKHPIAGKGFAFSFEELQYNALLAQSGDAARFGGLLSSGGYHNGILFLAVKTGIPTTAAFILAFLSIFSRFLTYTKHENKDNLKIFCTGLSAIMICTTAKMLTNGGPLDIFNMTIYMGIMQGILMKQQNNKEIETA